MIFVKIIIASYCRLFISFFQCFIDGFSFLWSLFNDCMSSIRETEMNNSFTLTYLNPIVLFILMLFFFYYQREMLKIKNPSLMAGFKHGKWVNHLRACMPSTPAGSDIKDPQQQWLLTENSDRVLHKEGQELVDGWVLVLLSLWTLTWVQSPSLGGPSAIFPSTHGLSVT